MLNTPRTGISDAHLRPDLRAQNPLYELAGSVTACFETERCPYHAMSVRAFEKTEQARRWDAISRQEKHIVPPPRLWTRLRIENYARISSPQVSPVLRPTFSLGYASDATAFYQRQSCLHRAVLGADRNTKQALTEPSANDVRDQFNAPRRAAQKLSRQRSRNRGRYNFNLNPPHPRKEYTMSEGPPGNERKSDNAPDFEMNDGTLRVATWLNEAKHGLLPSSMVENRYLDDNGEWRRTNKIGQGDHLRLARLLTNTHDEILEHQQEYKRTQSPRIQDWADEDRSPEQARRDAHDDRLADDRARTRRRSKPRDRSAR